ncbi:MAG: hypothetical protein FJY82_14640 [Candidatus Aminicenantes bacterium]|nr:hypothetical protein [Candidatus Aminicenantes bacterium]
MTSKILFVLTAALCLSASGQISKDGVSFEPRMRVIRTGTSLEALRAEAGQVLDFGLEVLLDKLKVDSYREDKTIIPWEEAVEKYFRWWALTMDEYERKMEESKMDLTRVRESRKKTEAFIEDVRSTTETVVTWKWRTEMERYLLDYDLKDCPKELEEIKSTIREAESLLAEAEAVLRKGGAAAEIGRAVDKAQKAFNLAEKAAKYMTACRKFVVKSREKKKTSLDSNITAVRDRWKSMGDYHPDIPRQYTTVRIAGNWPEVITAYWTKYQKTWKDWEAFMEVYNKTGYLDEFAHFRGVDYADLASPPDKVLSALKSLR